MTGVQTCALPIFKAANPTLDSKTVFKMAIDEWKKQKGQEVEQPKVEEPKVEEPVKSSVTPQPVSDHKATPNSQPIPDPQPEPEPVKKEEEPEEKKTKKARKPKKTTEPTNDE